MLQGGRRTASRAPTAPTACTATPAATSSTGDAGSDLLYGGNGPDYLNPAGSANRVSGGAGRDKINVATASHRQRVNGGPAFHKARANLGDAIRFVEKVRVTTPRV